MFWKPQIRASISNDVSVVKEKNKNVLSFFCDKNITNLKIRLHLLKKKPKISNLIERHMFSFSSVMLLWNNLLSNFISEIAN